MKKKNITDITFIVDRSGSMGSVRQDTIGGFNTFLEDQKKTEEKTYISFHQFNQEYETVYENRELEEAPNLTEDSYVPGGTTALLDAIGRTIASKEEFLKRLKDEEKPTKIVFVIVTDGLENASSEYTRGQIKEMITHRESSHAWKFVYLGANQDSFAEGGNMGFATKNTMNYRGTGQGMKKMFCTMSRKLTGYRNTAEVDLAEFQLDFTDEDRKENS